MPFPPAKNTTIPLPVGASAQDYISGDDFNQVAYPTATGSTTPRSAADRAADVVNVKDHGVIDGTTGDATAIQAAITAAGNAGGGLVVIPFGASQAVALESLTIPATVTILDERWSNSGHTAYAANSGDAELRIEDTVSGAGGDGPALVLQNRNITGTRTGSLVLRYGPKATQVVADQVRFGTYYTVPVTAWDPDFDFLALDLRGSGLMRSRFRVGSGGTIIVNPNNTDGNIYSVPYEGQTDASPLRFIVNAPEGGSVGNILAVADGYILARKEMRIRAANSPLRLYNSGGTLIWTLLTDLDASGEVALYDHTSSRSALRITGTGTILATSAAGAAVVQAIRVSADRGDTSQTLTVGTDATEQRWDTTLTANRTVTLSNTGALNGSRFHIVRTGLGAFTLTVQDATPTTIKVIPSATAASVDATFNGTAWKLSAYGPL